MPPPLVIIPNTPLSLPRCGHKHELSLPPSSPVLCPPRRVRAELHFVSGIRCPEIQGLGAQAFWSVDLALQSNIPLHSALVQRVMKTRMLFREHAMSGSMHSLQPCGRVGFRLVGFACVCVCVVNRWGINATQVIEVSSPRPKCPPIVCTPPVLWLWFTWASYFLVAVAWQ
jgi:hypothetical protein